MQIIEDCATQSTTATAITNSAYRLLSQKHSHYLRYTVVDNSMTWNVVLKLSPRVKIITMSDILYHFISISCGNRRTVEKKHYQDVKGWGRDHLCSCELHRCTPDKIITRRKVQKILRHFTRESCRKNIKHLFTNWFKENISQIPGIISSKLQAMDVI